MLTNYKACAKTKAPAVCSIDCCGTKFGRAHNYHARRPQSAKPKRKMRRYARHAEKNLIYNEVQQELSLLDGLGYTDSYVVDIGPKEQYPYDAADYYNMFSAIQQAFHRGLISRSKYYRLVDVLNGLE